MELRVFTDGSLYYSESGGAMGSLDTLTWRLNEAGHWFAEKGQRPAGVRQADFANLPGELQEELLAVSARAEAMGPMNWDFKN